MNNTPRIMRFLFLILFFSACCSFIFTIPDSASYAEGTSVMGLTQTLKTLSPEQRSAVEAETKKTGGVLTSKSINTLKNNQLFKGLTPEEITKGETLLERKDREVTEAKENHKSTDAFTHDSKEKTASLFSRYRTVGPYQSISTELKPFGFDFFSGTNGRALTPHKDIPVSPDYIIGPGDEVKILLWGRVNEQYDLIVNRDGNIMMPQIGPLQVSGMRFNEMNKFLTEQSDQIVGANINVTMGMLKSIQVFVLGEVARPGSYALGSFSTITSALLAAGGPTDIGSLRNIQLKRNNRRLGAIDFYDFLLKGDKSGDKVLQSGDVVFIPTAGPLVGLAGNVRRPAIYELKGKYDLGSLFEMAGGLIPNAYTQQIQVERIQENERRIVIDINDKNLTRAKNVLLQDGDLVKVFSIVDKDVNVLFLSGNVKRPGKYEYKPGMRIRDLISSSSDLLDDTYFEYAVIKRISPSDSGKELLPFNIGILLFDNDEDNNIQLESRDEIYVFSKSTFHDMPSVAVEGEVRKQGSFDLLDNYKVKDAVLEAGGLTKDASMDKGEIFRVNNGGDISQIYFNLGLAMNEDPDENILLQDRDKIIIHSIWEKKHKQTVSIDGDLKSPGTYPLAQDMTVKDLIFTSGNILESAFLDEAEISSHILEDGKPARIEYRTIHLKKALENDPAHNIVLKPYDRLFVKRIPGWHKEKYVSFTGQFIFPGNYILKKGERLSSLIERAGGYTDKAYLRGAVFTRNSIEKLQKKSLDEMILRFESRLFSEGSAEVSTAISTEAIESKKVEMEQKQKFLESLKKLKATGRMTIRLAHLRLLKNSEYDLELEEGDSLHIPMRNSVVSVVGSVMSAGSHIYSKRTGYKNYIEMAGGYTRYADEENVYVLKVDGSARKLAKGFFDWNVSKSRWEMTPFGKEINEIEPGDTIVVPEQLERIAWMREIKDITQILYQMAVTAGVLIVAF